MRFSLATANITIQSKLPKPIEKLILALKNWRKSGWKCLQPGITDKKLSTICEIKNPPENPVDFLAEREGFEPPVPLGTTVFKTAAFDHSAISPDAVQK